MRTNHSKSLASRIASALLIGTLLSAAGCGKAASSTIAAVAPAAFTSDDAPTPVPASRVPTEVPPSFETFTIEKPSSIATLRARIGEDGLAQVLKLNRVDLRHLAKGQTLIVPRDKRNLLRLSPFPAELASVNSVPKLLLVSRATQAFGAYEFGKLVRWGPVSTGKKATPTPTGLYFANWKSRSTRSSVDPSWILPWYVNIDSRLGIGLHQYDLPGYAASHGCVRLMKDDAQWIFGWADQWVVFRSDKTLARGTPVIIFGDYRYATEPPWKQLTADPDAARISPAELEAVLGLHAGMIKARTQDRLALVAATVSKTNLQL
jgi:lipoprotein-anchoring transpeptidase ErfK/SrfK